MLLLQVLVTYGTRVLAAPPSGDPYGQRYKGIWCSLMVLTRALGGNYVNFGVFELYGDPALKVLTLKAAWLQALLLTCLCKAFKLPGHSNLPA